MATVTVFGATGGTGRQLLQQALLRGYHVRAVCRRTNARLPEGVEALIGNLRDDAFLDIAIGGADAVLCALGPRPPYQEMYLATATDAIVAAMRRRRVRRLIAITGAMAGSDIRLSPFMRLLRWLFRRAQPDIAQDRLGQEAVIRASGLDWTMVRPPRLTNAAPTGRLRIGGDLHVSAFSRIARADVAAFMLDEVETPQHLRAAVIVQQA